MWWLDTTRPDPTWPFFFFFWLNKVESRFKHPNFKVFRVQNSDQNFKLRAKTISTTRHKIPLARFFLTHIFLTKILRRSPNTRVFQTKHTLWLSYRKKAHSHVVLIRSYTSRLLERYKTRHLLGQPTIVTTQKFKITLRVKYKHNYLRH